MIFELYTIATKGAVTTIAAQSAQILVDLLCE